MVELNSIFRINPAASFQARKIDLIPKEILASKDLCSSMVSKIPRSIKMKVNSWGFIGLNNEQIKQGLSRSLMSIKKRKNKPTLVAVLFTCIF